LSLPADPTWNAPRSPSGWPPAGVAFRDVRLVIPERVHHG
jgi:hypothetical protein